MKTFHDKYKQKEFMTTEPALQKILKGILHAEKEKKKPTTWKYRQDKPDQMSRLANKD
jgi:hypothetical protein